MLATRVIPCLDTRDGRVVKGIRFSQLRDIGSPQERAVAYEEQGADEIVLLDISATPEGRRHRLETVREVRDRLSIPLTVGGGVRGPADVEALLEAGADKVAINTAAVEKPERIAEIARRFGSQCTVLAMDAAAHSTQGQPEQWRVVVRSGSSVTDLDAVAWAAHAVSCGAGEILLTSWDRDGTRSGYDLDLLRAVSSVVSVPIIASGGADSPEHFLEAIHAGADAILAASIFHDGNVTVREVKEYLAERGVEVRL